MASLTIRNLDEPVKARLRVRAAQNGQSMEEEARQILRAALAQEPPIENLADAIRSLFAPLGGVELDTDWLRQEPIRPPPSFDE